MELDSDGAMITCESKNSPTMFPVPGVNAAPKPVVGKDKQVLALAITTSFGASRTACPDAAAMILHNLLQFGNIQTH
jgi:hypothetical protein